MRIKPLTAVTWLCTSSSQTQALEPPGDIRAAVVNT